MFELAFMTPMVAIIVLILALIIFGPGKLPELGKALGKGINEFKNASEGNEKKQNAQQLPEQPKDDTKV